ncbi:MAG: exodeoxyribonuclease VII small subunit [Clostridia bacterium]|nr:exodeoxyribonuclease VII small subunit [Clostridia bacterium]
MAAKKKQTFEERLEQLEGLVKAMEEGGMTLEETLTHYEKGIKLAAQLKQDLEIARERLTVLGEGSAEEA